MAAEHRPETPDGDSRHLSVAQVARRLGCSVSLVQKWRRLGWLHATRLGPPDVPVYGYLPEDVDRFVQERWNRRRGRPPGSPNTAAQRDASQPAVPSRSPFSTPLRPRSTQPQAPAAPAPPAVERVSTAPPAAPAVPAASNASDVFRPLTPQTEPAPGRSTPEPTGRPLVLWDADPAAGRPIVLARFAAGELDYAMSVAAAWSGRYPTLVLGELPIPGDAPHILARWENGARQAGA